MQNGLESITIEMLKSMFVALNRCVCGWPLTIFFRKYIHSIAIEHGFPSILNGKICVHFE